jgi:signal transduction histidine kinase
MSSVAGDPEIQPEALATLTAGLRAQAARFESLCAMLPGVICTFEIRPGGTLFLPYANPALAALYGDAGIGPGVSPIYDQLHPADVARVRVALDRAARMTAAWRLEFRLRHPVYGERWIDGQGTPLRDADGAVRWLGYFQDVSARKRAERRFAAQQAVSSELVKARALADVAPRVLAALCAAEDRARGVYWEVDGEAGVLRRRDGWPAGDRGDGPTTCRSGEGAAGQAWAARAPVVDHDAIAVPVVLGDRVLAVLELVGGDPRVASETLRSSLDAVSLQLAQFAERVRAEDALRESELRLLSVIENLSEGVILFTLDGRIVHWNPAAIALHDLTPDDEWRHSLSALGDRFAFESLEGEPVVVHDRPLRRAFRGELLRNHEVRISRTDREWSRVFSYGSALVRQPDGEQLAVLNVTDVTERVRATAALHELNGELERRVVERTAELEAANRELEAFSYSVSHDLRTPLRAVNGFAQILIEDFSEQLAPEGKRLLGVVRDGAQRMGQLIDDLLTFSRLGRQPVNRRAIDMTALVRSVVAELAVGYPGAEVQIDELPPSDADPALVRQIWVNLVSNALKYSQMRDPAVIQIGSEAGVAAPIYFVRDNGIGFAMTFADMLFKVFQRLHSQDQFEGTGVGLAIVDRIATRHGGRVWGVGAVDHGATFCFTLHRGG